MQIRFRFWWIREGIVWSAGDVAELPQGDAIHLIEAGIAVPVKATPELQTAIAKRDQVETTELVGR